MVKAANQMSRWRVLGESSRGRARTNTELMMGDCFRANEGPIHLGTCAKGTIPLTGLSARFNGGSVVEGNFQAIRVWQSWLPAFSGRNT